MAAWPFLGQARMGELRRLEAALSGVLDTAGQDGRESPSERLRAVGVRWRR